MEAALKNHDIEAFKSSIPSTSNEETKEAVNISTERLIRSRAMEMVKNNSSLFDIEKQFSFIVELAKSDLCPKTLTVLFMNDILECSPKQRCSEIFTIIENYIDIWKEQEFFESCRNSILRMCNDLLKRLSRTIDTQFCGRVNILLSRSLPLFEKSGLNIAGQFNSTNDTTYDEIDEIELKSSDNTNENNVDIDIAPEIPVDFNLYQNFWSLQKYFSDPNKVYQLSDFETFQNNLNNVLNVFTTYRLDKKRGIKEYEHYQKMEGIEEEFKRADVFFAKYQTSQKLIHLQFADPQFRRYFLVQLLILTNYLQSEVNQKFRDITLFLTEDQSKYVNEITEKCYKLLRDTYPKGFQFSEFVKKILNREKIWTSWKNEGCPDWLGSRPERQLKSFRKQEIEHYNPNIVDLGNKALNALWSGSQDNLAACRDIKRNFVPSVEEVLEEALDHADPDQGVEAEYSCFNNEVWQWKSNRLFLIEADNYLTVQSTPPGKKPCPEYSEVLQRAVLAVAMNGKNETLKNRANEITQKIAEAKVKAEEAAKKAEEEAKQKAEDEAKQKVIEAAAERKRKEEEADAQRKKELAEMEAKKKNEKVIKEEKKDEKEQKQENDVKANGNGTENSVPNLENETSPNSKKEKKRIKEEKLLKEDKKERSRPTTPSNRKRDRRSITPITEISDDESIPKKRSATDHVSRHSSRSSRDDRHRRSSRREERVTSEKRRSSRSRDLR